MGIIYIYIYMSTLFFNFCLHRLQNLNCYNHGFLNYLQIFESRWNVFASILVFQAPQYWCGEYSNIIFLVNQVYFHN